MASSAAIASAIGRRRLSAPAPATTSTSIISWVAYAFEESASEEKTGRARNFGSSWCSAFSEAIARPRSSRFRGPPPATRGASTCAGTAASSHERGDQRATRDLFGDPAVPDARLGHDQRRGLRVVAELLAQRSDVGAQVRRLGAVPLTPDLAQQPLMGEELAGVRDERLEQPVLRRGQAHLVRAARDEPLREDRPATSRNAGPARRARRSACDAWPPSTARAALPCRTAW